MKYRYLLLLILVPCILYAMEESCDEIAVKEYGQRRQALVHAVHERYKDKGPIVLFSGFEKSRTAFSQESSFYYFTGLDDTALVIILDEDKTTLLVPNYDKDSKRPIWADYAITPKKAQKVGLTNYEFLGDEVNRYGVGPFAYKTAYYKNLLKLLKEKSTEQNKKIYTLLFPSVEHYTEHIAMARDILSLVQTIPGCVEDITPEVGVLRRTKSYYEIKKMVKAMQVTLKAHKKAAQTIKPGITELAVKKKVEGVFTEAGAYPAYFTIVGTGKNAVVLHHGPARKILEDGDLVLIDAGAELDHYCTDITRVFPVSGTFSERQKELYNMVLETQAYVAERARPGMVLKGDKEYPERSLGMLAQGYLKEKGYDQYFPHGIGHYLGLDVHDLGSYDVPLQPGDIITIEPGVYIPQENIGIRIEDNYLITNDGVVCLSKDIPKTIEEIEQLMRKDSK
jgi:Xaa-Pro aminopeptidase